MNIYASQSTPVGPSIEDVGVAFTGPWQHPPTAENVGCIMRIIYHCYYLKRYLPHNHATLGQLHWLKLIPWFKEKNDLMLQALLSGAFVMYIRPRLDYLAPHSCSVPSLSPSSSPPFLIDLPSSILSKSQWQNACLRVCFYGTQSKTTT